MGMVVLNEIIVPLLQMENVEIDSGGVAAAAGQGHIRKQLSRRRQPANSILCYGSIVP
jgi:hypothetical protein